MHTVWAVLHSELHPESQYAEQSDLFYELLDELELVQAEPGSWAVLHNSQYSDWDKQEG